MLVRPARIAFTAEAQRLSATSRAMSIKAVEIDRVLERIAGPHNALIYVGKDYTLVDLETDLVANA